MKSLFALPLVVVVGLACGPRPTPSRVLPALRVSPEVVDLGNAAVSSTGELKSRVSLKNLGMDLFTSNPCVPHVAVRSCILPGRN